MIETLRYFAYASCWKFLRMLPEVSAYKFGNFVADVAFRKNGKGVIRLKANLARVRPEFSKAELNNLVKRAMRSYLRYWVDTFRFIDWDKSKILNSARIVNEEYFYGSLANGKGLIVSLPHAGNWDHAGAYFCAQDIPLTTVVEHLKPERLFKKFLVHREKMGMEALDLNARVSATLAQRLRGGKLVALVADRDLSRSGITVNFFDGVARMPGGPAALAIDTGAPLVTAYVSYQPSGITITFEAPIAVPISGTKEEQILVMTQKCADRFAENISKFPEDWHMLQRIWVDGDFTERSE
jgi:phosphatidylinositol dimannoside acyltransferase